MKNAFVLGFSYRFLYEGVLSDTQAINNACHQQVLFLDNGRFYFMRSMTDSIGDIMSGWAHYEYSFLYFICKVWSEKEEGFKHYCFSYIELELAEEKE